MSGNWLLGQSSPDPLQHKAEALVTFCFPNASMYTPGSNESFAFEALQNIITGDNMKTFLHQYKHFHSHWPLIHTPTFDPLSANDGLVLTMCCIGAVYTNRLGSKEVRWLMELVRSSVLRSSQIYKTVTQNQVVNSIHLSANDIEELQAICLSTTLLLWHGDQRQRQKGREEFWALATIARRTGLLRPLPQTHPQSSALHRPGPITSEDVNSWNWTSWIENEKRARLMTYIFLLDACSVIYFNEQPQFDVNEIKAVLPADDAAWDAKSEEECAGALGLRGEAAQATNTSGSRRPKQMGMAEALEIMFAGNRGRFPDGGTNVLGKFILIHAIHVQIYNVQRQLLYRVSSSGTSTPKSQSEAPVTPPSGINEKVQQLLRSTVTGLELWKTCWDIDLAIQFPQNERRRGFCRDGVHFYFLARVFLRNSRREEWAAPPDIRCRHVFHFLKQIRAYVASDSAQKGIDIGSVTTIADDYGIADLTLDMKHLFTPLQDP